MVNIYHGKLIDPKLLEEALPDFGSGSGVASVFLLWRSGK
jgi:hypothetical protein